MNTQEYIEYLIQKQLYDNQDNRNALNRYKSGLDTANRWGQNLQTAGNYLQGVNNNTLNNIGSGMSKAGNYLQNGASKLTPKFTGFSQQSTNPAIQGALNDALGNAGVNVGINTSMGTIGNAVADTAGGSLAGVGNTIGAESAGATAGGASGAMAGGPVGALIALGAMALNGANRKRAKQSSENLMKQTNQMANAIENDTSTQDFSNKMIQQSQNNIAGTMTGGASPIVEPSEDSVYQGSILQSQPQSTNSALGSVVTPNINNAIMTNDIYNAPVDNNIQTGSVSENNTEKVKNGLLSKFMNGVSDFAKGYQENRNTGYSPDNFNQDRFAEQTTTYTPNQQLVDYQNSLRNQGIDENVVNAVAEGKNSGNKDIDEWIKANPEALKPVANIQTTYTGKEKGKMARFGEGVGTLARMLQNPNFQGLVAGGLGTVLTGNPLYGLGLGYKMANQRAMSEVYRNVLKQNGIDIPDTGTFGNVTSTDMKNIGTLAEAHNWHQYLNQVKLEELARRRAHDEVLKEHYTNQDKARQQVADARTTSAQASLIKANKTGAKGSGAKGGGKSGSGKGGGKGGVTKPEQHPDWGKDLAEYNTLINDPRYATKITQLKSKMIAKYKVDPDKYIKD